MMFILLSGAYNKCYTVLGLVVEADPGTHHSLIKECKLFIYPLLYLRTLKNDLF